MLDTPGAQTLQACFFEVWKTASIRLWFYMGGVAQVVQSKADDKEGYTALQLGIGSKRPKQVNGTQIGHFNAAGVPIKRKLQEFRISEVNAGAVSGSFFKLWQCVICCQSRF